MPKYHDPKDFGVLNYSHYSDGSLNIYQDLDLSGLNKAGLTTLPFNINYIQGNIIFGEDKIDSLKGLPKVMNGTLQFAATEIYTLEHCPEIVGGFTCNYTQIDSLKFAPALTKTDSSSNVRVFDVAYNKITSFKDCPNHVLDIVDVSNNLIESFEGDAFQGAALNISRNRLTSLRGCPETISGYFNCSFNDIKTLEFGPKYVKGDYVCRGCNLTDVRGLPFDVSRLNISDNHLTSLDSFKGNILECLELSNNPIVKLGLNENQLGNKLNNYIFMILDETPYCDLAELEELNKKIADYEYHYEVATEKLKRKYIRDNLK